jgi:hypothetical protein
LTFSKIDFLLFSPFSLLSPSPSSTQEKSAAEISFCEKLCFFQAYFPLPFFTLFHLSVSLFFGVSVVLVRVGIENCAGKAFKSDGKTRQSCFSFARDFQLGYLFFLFLPFLFLI